MTVLHRPGVRHGNADGMSRIPDDLDFCDCYRAGYDLETLPCYDPHNPCKHCTRAHNQWSRFEEDVDDVIPLAIRSTTSDSSTSVIWLAGYTHEDLKAAQEADSDLSRMRTWLTTGVEPAQKELALCNPAVKYFHLHQSQLKIDNELLYYVWKDELKDRLLLVVPHEMKEKVMSLNHDLPLSG